MSSTMWKNGISKVVHNREIVEAKKTGWTFSPARAIVKPKTFTKARILVGEVEIIKPTTKTTDLSGPEDFNQEGD
jgi:hypothetical protein